MFTVSATTWHSCRKPKRSVCGAKGRPLICTQRRRRHQRRHWRLMVLLHTRRVAAATEVVRRKQCYCRHHYRHQRVTIRTRRYLRWARIRARRKTIRLPALCFRDLSMQSCLLRGDFSCLTCDHVLVVIFFRFFSGIRIFIALCFRFFLCHSSFAPSIP